MTILDAPYNFAPLAEIVADGWGDDLPSHDHPYADGLCGEMALTITAESPLLIAGDQTEGQKAFFTGPDGKRAIPGSSLKGMLRNLVEIISFSRIGPHVENRRFGLRDLSGPVQTSYRNYFRDYGDGEGKSLGGWLRFENGGWWIEPCAVSRIPYPTLSAINRRFRPDKEAEKSYKSWGAASLDHQGGRLVFTGKVPIRNPRKEKKAEFVFHASGAEKLLVSEDVWRGFLDVHEHQEKPSPTWKYWQGRYQSGKSDAIPVFYLHDPARGVIALGLAQMFKLAMPHSTHDFIPDAHKDTGEHEPTSPSELDLASRIFGRVAASPTWEVAPDAPEKPLTCRGRVAISMAQLSATSAQPQTLGGDKGYETVTGGPKAGFFPAYLRQPDLSRPHGGYTTYMQTGGRLRGWKRYPGQIRQDYTPPPPPEKSGEKSRSRLQPITGVGGKLAFETVLRFHNLRPYELGALVWALGWGGDADARHALGMGKAYGWGRVHIALRANDIRPNMTGKATPSLEDCAAAFIAKMTGRIANWRGSPQITSLLAMAKPRDPELSAPHRLKYHSGNPQDFQKAKNNRAVLPDYGIAPQPASPPPAIAAAPSLLRAGEQVVEAGSGETGEIVEDQRPGEKTVLVDFFGEVDEVEIVNLKRV